MGDVKPRGGRRGTPTMGRRSQRREMKQWVALGFAGEGDEAR
jgi:hypothetical protein